MGTSGYRLDGVQAEFTNPAPLSGKVSLFGVVLRV